MFLQIAQLLALFIFMSVSLVRINLRRLRESLKHKIQAHFIYRLPANISAENCSFLNFKKSWNFYTVSAWIFLFCNENSNSFLTRVQKLFNGGNYLRKCGKPNFFSIEILPNIVIPCQWKHCIFVSNSWDVSFFTLFLT